MTQLANELPLQPRISHLCSLYWDWRGATGWLPGQSWVGATVLCPNPLPTFFFNLSDRELLPGLGVWKLLPLLSTASSLRVDKHITEQKASVGGGDLCGFLWPLAASKVPVSHCSSKKKVTRFPQPLVSWVNVQVPEHDPELGVVVRPAYLFQQVSFETRKNQSPPLL